jgi:hypothetical protein
MEWLPAQRYRYDGCAVAGVSACMAVDDVSMVIIRQTREHIQQDGGLGAAGALVNGMGWFLMFAFAETDWGAVAASVHLTAAVGCSKWENASRPRVLAPAETASEAGEKKCLLLLKTECQPRRHVTDLRRIGIARLVDVV